MRHSDSRGPLPPPGGRRIPPTASAKPAKAEDRPNARDLLASVNSASSGASTSWIAFLGAMAYLAVTLSGITHVDLLLDRETTLPFVSVKVPLTAFFVAAPLAFVLVHFGLLLQHVVLSRKLRAFEERLWKEQPTRNRREQPIRDELHSYSFTQSVSGMPKGAAVDMALRLVMSLTLVVFPLLLLTFFQIGFLPYHSEPITWWHRGMLLVDAAIIVVLTRYMARRHRKKKVRLGDWRDGRLSFRAKLVLWRRRTTRRWLAVLGRVSLPIRGRDFGPALTRVPYAMLGALRGSGIYRTRAVPPNRFVMGVLVLFSVCVATLPHSPDVWVPLDKWMSSLSFASESVPFCWTTERMTVARKMETAMCPEDTSSRRRAFYPTAYLFDYRVDEMSGRSDSWLGWSRNLIITDKDLVLGDDDKRDKRINLRGRDLRYATLDRSNLRRADFEGARLGGSHLFGTDLTAAKFRAASLQGARLVAASLQGADLSLAILHGAKLDSARLEGADLRVAFLQGASLYETSLQGADLRGAYLNGANVTGASLEGADLSEADLQGATLNAANLQGADLSRADLRGANLYRAGLQGANLSAASLQGAGLSSISVWRSSFRMPVHGDGLDLVSLATWDIDPRDAEELAKTIAELRKLSQQISKDGMNIHQHDDEHFKGFSDTNRAKEDAKGRALVEVAVHRISDKLRPLHGAEGDDKWWASDDLSAWCKLARQPQPDLAKLSTYLGTLARDDDTDKAYMAQQLIARALELKPNSFLEAFKESPGFDRLPADLKSRLKRAAQQERESAANAKEDSSEAVQPAQLEAPPICAVFDNKPAEPATTGSTKPQR